MMDGSNSQFQFGELEKETKTMSCLIFPVDPGDDSVYAETMRAESREPRAESRELLSAARLAA